MSQTGGVPLCEIAKLNRFGPIFSKMMQDFRFAARITRKNPGSTAAAFLALALAIGGATAIFSAVNAVMLRPLPVRDAKTLVRIFATDSSGDEDDVSMADYLDWRRGLRSFSGMAIFGNSQATLEGGAAPERVVKVEAESTLLPLLGIVPICGRTFLPEENEPGHSAEAILSWPFWQSHFGGRNVLGRKLKLDERPYTVIGILPKNFTLLGHRDVLLPLPFDPKAPQNRRGYHAYSVFARLAPGVTIERANAELATIAASTAAVFPNQNQGVSAKAVSLLDSLQGEGIGSAQANFKPALLVLLAAVLCVLLIACGNVTNLNLVRARSRQREIAVRVAVGASRTQLFRQVLVESILLSLSAAVAGLALAFGLVRLFDKISLAAIPRLEETSIDFRVLLFTLAIGVLAGIGSGLLPALHSSQLDLNGALKQASGRVTESRNEQRLRRLFVALETGLAAVLLVECGLFVKSFARASEINPHFSTDHLLTVYLALPASRYGLQHPDATPPLVRGVLTRVRGLPGVISAATASDLPLTGTAAGGGLLLEGQARAAQFWDTPYVAQTDVSPQYFKTLKIRFLAGVDFEDRTSSAKVAIVNQALVRKLFHKQDPIGKRIAIVTDELDWRQIVGVVADVPQTSIEKTAEPEVFFPMTRLNAPWLALAVRVNGDPLRYIGSIKREIAKVDRAAAVFLPRTMEQIMEKQLQWRGLQTWVVGAFAFLAITLASLGVYAVIAYSVGQRRSEIGLRMALGASDVEVRRMILWQGVRPALIGGAIGLLCAFALARATANLLFGTKAGDAAIYALVAALLLLVSALASFFPARRAAALDPWKALRHE